jgi:hypothetical protein
LAELAPLPGCQQLLLILRGPLEHPRTHAARRVALDDFGGQLLTTSLEFS